MRAAAGRAGEDRVIRVGGTARKAEEAAEGRGAKENPGADGNATRAHLKGGSGPPSGGSEGPDAASRPGAPVLPRKSPKTRVETITE